MNPTLTKDSRRLLSAVFPKGSVGQVWLANAGDWKGGAASTIPLNHAKANYYSTATMKAGATTRSDATAERVYAVVADDVGARIDPLTLLMELPEEAPPPFEITTTFKGSVLKPGQDAGENRDLYDEAGVALRDNKQWGWIIAGGGDPSKFGNPTAYRRLPQGVSEKNGSPTVLTDDAGLSTPVPEALALKIAAAIAKVSPGKVHSAPGGKTSGKGPQKASLTEVKLLLDSIDNTDPLKVDYDTWIDVGLAVYGAVGEEGRDAWIKWSYTSPAAGIKYLPEDKWLTFKGTHSAGYGALEILAKALGKPASAVFDDGVEYNAEPLQMSSTVLDIPKLPRRPWVYGKRLVRGYSSTTVAAGGVGKSSLTLVEALSMVSGKDLLGVGIDKMPRAPLRVWIWNGEDPQEEIDLRVGAACLHYNLNQTDIADRLFTMSGRETPIKLALPAGKGGVVVNTEMVERIKATIRKHKIDVLMIDPLVSAHYANENDNMSMDLVVKTIGAIAGECGCAVEIVHHTRKGNGNGDSEVTVDDARGAGAVINAARYLRVLTPMTRKVGEKHGIANYRSYFCVSKDAVKTNMTPPLDSDHWYRMVSVDLGNGDPFPADGGPAIESEKVGVAEKWSLTVATADRPDLILSAQKLMEGKVWRYDAQSPDWVGAPIAEALGIDLAEGKTAKASVKSTIDKWIREGWLRKVQGVSARHPVVCVEKANEPVVEF